ncbi:uncharacterized protein LOC112905609 [Agrilus planipennis]|uniref:Uncharacterized protein LOC112905609 n=1 Tax=Agrilus planipennis TaxID=224129 RepID=A0A7F5RDT1_AGRPL|nr:uncharacterized protein LOC112905609 [Agrilus planipennis]
MENGYKKYMMLKIKNVNINDFGSYKCVAKNSLGETDGVIKLEEIPAPTTVKTTLHSPTSLAKKKGKNASSEGLDNRVIGDQRQEMQPSSDYGIDDDYTISSNGSPVYQEVSGCSRRCSRLFLAVLLIFVLRTVTR